MPGDDRPSARSVAAIALAAAYGWWAVGLTPFTWEATVAVVGAGGAVAAWATWQRRLAGPGTVPGRAARRGTGAARGRA